VVAAESSSFAISAWWVAPSMTRAIDAAGRFSLMVQRTAPTIRYVSVDGAGDQDRPG
jgi:hypothetical protein